MLRPLHSDSDRSGADAAIDAMGQKPAAGLFDQFVGQGQQVCRNVDPELLCGFEIEH